MRKMRSIVTAMAALFTAIVMLGCGDMSNRDAGTVVGSGVGGVAIMSLDYQTISR